ncbi:MAG TPA: arsenate reductase ArsC [Puia sp.]
MSNLQHKVLFVCIHNSARSQMAEVFLNKYGEGNYQAESAGLEPGKLNPNVVKVMREVGIDLSQKGTQSVFDLFRRGALYNAVITVCDGASAEQCPIFPGRVKRVAWSFEDPSAFKGTEDEVLQHTRDIRNEIEKAIKDFIRESSVVSYWI